MANWCSNDITFFTENNTAPEFEMLKKLYELLDSIYGQESQSSGNMYSELVTFLGLSGDITTYCGAISSIEADIDISNDTHFYISTETKWAPLMEFWDILLQSYPGICYVYVAEECGSEIFINSDIEKRFYETEYYLHLYIENFDDIINKQNIQVFNIEDGYQRTLDGDAEYFDSEKGVLDFLRNLFVYQAETIVAYQNYVEELGNLYNDSDCSIYLNLHKYRESYT